MLSRRAFMLAGIAAAAGACSGRTDGGRNDDSRIRQLAGEEGSLRIDAATDQHEVDDLLAAFTRLHPGIALEYYRPTSADLHSRFLEDAAAGRPTADLLISSAMDLQFKLVNDGFAQAYQSPESNNLPAWAVWKSKAYAVTAEPIVFAYNRRLMPRADVPSSRSEFIDLLRHRADAYRGRIATYDPERSGTGYLYYTQDLLLSHDTMDLTEAVGRIEPKLCVSGIEIINRIASGELLFAYNMMSSYVLEKQSQDPDIGIVFPGDYTLIMSRVAFIPVTARHPAASRLFLDFLLSQQGQALLARRHMQPVRPDVKMEGLVLASETQRPIHFGPALLANLDQYRRRRVLREWRRLLRS